LRRKKIDKKNTKKTRKRRGKTKNKKQKKKEEGEFYFIFKFELLKLIFLNKERNNSQPGAKQAFLALCMSQGDTEVHRAI
jgi:hypothetical protein